MSDFLLQSSWFIPFYGLIGSILSLPWSFRLIKQTGPRPAAYFNVFMTLVSAIHGMVALSAIWQTPSEQIVFHWLQVADLDLTLAVEISPVSLGALSVVTGISFLVQIFGLGYMEKDWSLARFYGLLGFFEAALGGIALSDSLFLSYGLLEMLTLSTYLLVGFWYAQPLVVTAARDAFLTKRVGDIILLMGVVALSSYGQGLTFSQLDNWASTVPVTGITATLLGLSLIAGPTGKCAQFPLNLWLDEAMEGPNPAGIMRNSVVVSAGAYVLIKLQPVFTLSPIASKTLIVLGTLTVVMTSLIAIAQIDIKRTLSHSTSVYLGLVFIAVGLGQVDIAFLLLFAHAIAKALLFMSIGSIIFTTSGQNITEMGGLWNRMPVTTTSFVVGSAGLLAVFPLGMFWTWQKWFSGDWLVSWPLLALLIFVNLFSALNLTRVFRLVFLGKPQPKTRRAPEVPWPMAVPMVSLIIVTLLVPIAPLQWSFWLSATYPLGLTSPVTQWAMPLLMVAGITGILLGSLMPLRRNLSRSSRLPVRFLQDLFAYDVYLDKIYGATVVAAVAAIAKISTWFDRYVIDGIVNLVSLVTIFSGSALKYNVTGQSQFYLLTILVGVALLIWFSLSGQWMAIRQFWSSWLSLILP
ncbi:NADH dehydrogenase subunit 5 [Synechocystis sp. PCC 6803]|uniref:NADH dehydrogenase subunit 5 n=1 Tax=Synechocystis sp. (strain ATCC 27184 / PCC 6803 / Kazusa) TaxID=1111708 RepID=Q55465_SYNY3|nr:MULTISPECIES: NAD(P)H-quinone oxidoreductase subunit F [unclassified Synechocystis]AGF53100.1 NADH dehydrogenase subunit 5 [Synechocystis sp. PCC 6803]ALJ68982.1 NAD(P)H-quinone oxidoreductase subunit F [Synechocystis sp. PCC 6803]AVP90846.1 NAD(P)H-quinone oxidoreductase subunit F [Synechocystis sp. IPPAS B-1465]MBD2617956.1 NAD(P)H-quinone oxidoreductase subunit F [Synechocystis sp. FACHB-898]MBD2639179.1 NAD(P)H-quinone oxidoreductase subunit F [Synechocystis sp. FACHB-908]